MTFFSHSPSLSQSFCYIRYCDRRFNYSLPEVINDLTWTKGEASMLFHSFAFLFVFLPTVFVIYFLFARFRWFTAAKVTLIIASLFFYAYWDFRYLVLLFFSIGINYLFGRLLSRNAWRWLLITGIIVNLSLLAYFKYVDFFLTNVNAFFGLSIPLLHVVLPLAISFFTFQQIAFLVDSYRGITTEYRFLNYMLFVVFFPQLIAGPIVHHKKVMPQFKDKHNFRINPKHLALGLFIFASGLFKKVVIADSVALWATPAFDEASVLTFFEAWGAALAYTFQLYFDFSGYSEMAIGLGLMFNIRLPVNFMSPYKANSIIDFWRRWHMTLSAFLKDYLYIPLGGNRKGKERKYVNLFVTMVLGGIWHGAGWTFVIWGMLHGLYNVINHVYRDWKKRIADLQKRKVEIAVAHEEFKSENNRFFKNSNISAQIGKWISFQRLSALPARLLTFFAVVIGWVFFRAATINDALKVLEGMFGLNGIKFGRLDYLPHGNAELIVLFGLFLWVSFAPNTIELSERLKPSWKWILLVSFLLTTAILFMNRQSEFLYFQF